MDAFVAGLPKAELHVHIEGTFEPELMFAIAARNGIELPYDNVEALRAAYRFSRLQDFLDIYYQGMAVLRTEQDFHDLTWAYCERAQAQCIRHVEIFFDPQGHTVRGVAFETALDGIVRALGEAERQFGMSSHVIMCFLRHLDEADAEATLDAALPHRERIVGVGLDSSEQGHPPAKFAQVFARARSEGFKLVAHAGEEGPPEYVWEAIDILGVDRIDHGNRALEDQALVKRLAADQTVLTVCPLSNLRLGGVSRIEDHPLRRMIEAGLKVTVNSDDPAYFGGYVNENFAAVQQALDLDRDTVVAIAGNSFDGAFIDQARRQALRSELGTYAAKA